MKKIHSAIITLLLVFGFSGTSSADFSADLGLLTSPGSYFIGTETSGGFGDLPLAPGSVTDDYIFSVNLSSNFGSALTSVNLTASSAFTSFNTALFVKNDSSWNLLASNVGTLFGGSTWLSTLFFSPLNPDPTDYKLQVTGIKGLGEAAYGGNISLSPVTPVPEPEIYAMLAAGLGLMGFVARRRQQVAA